MTSFKTPSEVWSALAEAGKGEARAKILKNPSNRKLILNSGSFVVFASGQTDHAQSSCKDKLAPIQVIQTQRLRSQKDGTVTMDGKGTFGGLSERTNPTEHLLANLDLSILNVKGNTIEALGQTIRRHIEDLVRLRDDLCLNDAGEIEQVTDLSEIARTSAARETIEEAMEIILGDDVYQKLGIDQQNLRDIFQKAALAPIPLTQVKDDNFAINIWDGDMENPAYAVTPFGHIVDLDQDVMQLIIEPGQKKMAEGLAILEKDPDGKALRGREILGVEALPLFEALKQWGKPSVNGGPDLTHDYRYPHEWFGVWYKAQMALEAISDLGAGLDARQVMMCNLVREVQQSIIDDCKARGEAPYNIDFVGAFKQMCGGEFSDLSQFEGLEEDLGLPHGTIGEMHKTAEDVMRDNGFFITSPFPADAAATSEAAEECNVQPA